MRWQTTAALAALLAILGGFYYLYEIQWAPGREAAESRRGRIFTADVKDATALEIVRKDGTVRVERHGEAWRMTKPVSAPAARGAVEQTLTTVLTAKSDREIEAAPARPADYGLAPPETTALVTLQNGRTLTLELGARSPTGVWVYAREGGRPGVVVVSDTVLRDVTRPVADFRDKTVLTFDRGAVSGLELVTPDGTIAVEPTGPGTWKITRPVSLPADGDSVGDLLDKLRNSEVKEFVAEAPRSLAPYGLDRPLRVTPLIGAERKPAGTLLLGRFDDAKRGWYAMRPGESSVLLLPEEVGRAVPRNVAALRDKVLVRVDRERINRIEIESPKGAVTLVKDADRWAITAPEKLPADQAEVGALLGKVRDLRAQGFLSDDGSAIPRVLARPTVRVTLGRTEGNPTTVLLAPSPERRSGEPSAYAAVAGAGPVVLVEGKALEALARSAMELRDKTLFARLEPRSVKRVRVTAGGQTAVFERSGDTEWRMLEPRKAAARGPKVDDLVYAIRALKWTSIASPSGTDAGTFGLDAPAMEVVLLGEGGTEMARLAVGRREGPTAYVRAGAAPPVYAVSDGALGPPPKVPDDFVE